MDDRQIGSALRALRIRRGWRQADLARRATVSRETVSLIERGRVGKVSLSAARGVADALEARFDTTLRWQGGDLGRLVSRRHAAMHEAMARHLQSLTAWTSEPEVSFSIYGERGTIDVLAWHAAARALLVIELKTELVDINEVMGTLDRKHRLANQIARERRWDAQTIGVWLVITDTRTNRRALAAHATVLRAKFQADGRTIRAWLHKPAGSIQALGFMPEVADTHIGRVSKPVRRVVRPRTAAAERG